MQHFIKLLVISYYIYTFLFIYCCLYVVVCKFAFIRCCLQVCGCAFVHLRVVVVSVLFIQRQIQFAVVFFVIHVIHIFVIIRFRTGALKIF